MLTLGMVVLALLTFAAMIGLLGDTPKAFNKGDGSRVIGSIGIGFSY